MKINNIINNLKKGTMIVEVEGFFIERFLNLCKSNNIEINEIKYVTSGLIIFKVDFNKFNYIKKFAAKTKCKARIKQRKGIYFVLFRYKKRRMFVYLLLSLFCALIILSTFIFKIEIHGNKKVSDKEILEVLKKSDVYVGKNRLFVDERKAGNMIRTEIYDIAWVSVKSKGTKIKIDVVEKKISKEDENKDIPGDIIAGKSGIITKIIAENGTPKLLTGSYIEKNMIAIEGIIKSEIIENMPVHASGILRVKNTYVYEIEEKYNIKEKKYTDRKKLGIGVKLNNKEYILKYLPKNYIYDINKREWNLNFNNNTLAFLFVKYNEYIFIEKSRSYDELINICKDKYEVYLRSIKSETSLISNEKIDIVKLNNGIRYKVTYDLEEDVGVFQKTGE